MTTGQRIKAARRKVGLTQTELAGKLGISFQSIAQWENDLRNPKLETLQKIASALNIPVTDLLTLEEEHETEDKKTDNRYTVFLCNGNFRDIADRKADYIRLNEVDQEELNVLLRIVRRHNQSNDENIDLVIETL